MITKIQEAENFLKIHGITSPEIGIVLGTGLGNLVRKIEIEVEINYTDIPWFPEATLEFHSGKLIYGTLEGKKIIVMNGRFHYYEGYNFQQITFPIRVMKSLGISHLLLSNAAGGINLNWKKGDLMLIDDHINLLPGNPLTGKNLDTYGPRFPDMSEPYSKKINALLMELATEKNITLRKGVYVAVSGPNLETRAEYRFLKIIGADAVGMSTVPEVIVANHMNLPCAAVSVLTDACDPDNLKPVDIADIIAIARQAELKLTELFVGLIKRL
ncbi:MAG: purine-nucleoside phosphorylase [Bacteroidia bacterium]|nr:purine-nucleoside phosphorylase [Bacteroidia bacterium]